MSKVLDAAGGRAHLLNTPPWLAKHTDLPIVLKGLETHEDTYLTSLYTPQVKGIILSNHGGRALDTAHRAVHALMEIRKYCPEVFDKIEVYVDAGIRRSTDVVKALCLGAKAADIGRVALWSLAAGVLGDESKTCTYAAAGCGDHRCTWTSIYQFSDVGTAEL